MVRNLELIVKMLMQLVKIYIMNVWLGSWYITRKSHMERTIIS